MREKDQEKSWVGLEAAKKWGSPKESDAVLLSVEMEVMR